MAPSSFSDDSEDDRDESFDEDMEALKRACVLTRKNPSEIETPTSAESDAESEDIDDLKLVRSIQKRFSLPTDFLPFLISKSGGSGGPGGSDEDDDFETLRAIQRRFSHYDRGRFFFLSFIFFFLLFFSLLEHFFFWFISLMKYFL